MDFILISVVSYRVEELAKLLVTNAPTFEKPVALMIQADRICDGCGKRYEEGDMENCRQCVAIAHIAIARAFPRMRAPDGLNPLDHCHHCEGKPNCFADLMQRMERSIINMGFRGFRGFRGFAKDKDAAEASGSGGDDIYSG